MRSVYKVGNTLESRIVDNYLHCSRDTTLCSLFEIIFEYYNKGITLNILNIISLEKDFSEKGKNIYLKSQEQIRNDMSKLEKRIKSYDLRLTIQDMDLFYSWSDIIGVNNKSVDGDVQKCLENIILKIFEKQFIPNCYNDFYSPVQNKSLNVIYEEIYKNLFNKRWEQIFDEAAAYIKKQNFLKLYEGYMLAFRDNSSSPTLQNIFINKLPCLLQDELFPKGEIDEKQLYCFRMIYKICFQLIPDELEKRKNEIINKYPEDIMLKKRIKDFEEQERIDFKAKAVQK